MCIIIPEKVFNFTLDIYTNYKKLQFIVVTYARICKIANLEKK